MKVGGQYVGLGLGDMSEEVRKIKAFMRPRFSYARALTDDIVYDAPMTDAVAEMQARYVTAGKLKPGAFLSGVINAETKYVMGYLKRPPGPDLRPVLFTVCGTAVPWWVGPDADTARAVEDRWLWQPVGYPAAVFPMNPSVQNGRTELCNQMERWRTRIEQYGCALIGYSQGAVVTAECWEYDIKPTSGRLHWALPHVRKAVTFGNPMREQGKAWPDPGAQVADPDSHGIADRLMVDTPDWWRNYAHRGDLYTDCAGDSGENKTAIYKIVMGTRVFTGADSILAQVLEIASGSVSEIIAAAKAILDAGMFFAKGTGPHVNYSTQPAIEFLRS